MIKLLLFLSLTNLLSPPVDNYPYDFKATAKAGDGVIALLSRYHLASHPSNIDAFYALNNLDPEDPLIADKSYILPIRIYRYNGKSIRSTIGDNDYEKALRIKAYNELILSKHLRKTHYTASNILWVPHHELESTASSVTKSHEVATRSISLPVLGPQHKDVEITSDVLEGHIYYVVTGHGGPDPGAVGKRNQSLLCEDEYAYDVALRLYRNLWSQGAIAYLIIEDKNDGIRSDEILMCDHDETCQGAEIPLNQAKRLRQRVEVVNSLYAANSKKDVKSQTFIAIHVDSRSKNHKQDVFFCHYPTSKSSRKLASDLQQTFAAKYSEHRKNGEYQGAVSPRNNLFVLKNTAPKAVLIELANIQNKSDHRRIIQPSNRQALANWITQGLIRNSIEELADR